MNTKMSKNRIHLSSLHLNQSKVNKHCLQVLYVGITFCGQPASLFGAMTVLVIWMIFSW